LYDIKPKTLSYYYKHITSDYAKEMNKPPWESIYHNIEKNWLVLSENIWTKLCIDEKNVWWQVITILSNPVKDKIIAEIPWTQSKPIVEKIESEISIEERRKVTEICLDMSNSMEAIIDALFPNAYKVHDRFHVIKNILEDLNAIKIRIKTVIKKKVLEEEKKVKNKWKKYLQERYINWETLLEMISRSHYQLYKRQTDRKYNQRARRTIMKWLEIFKELCLWYDIVQDLQSIYDNCRTKHEAILEMKERLEKSENIWERIDEIWNMNKLIDNHKETIVNYFISRHTNWYAEWLNSRIDHLNSMSKWFADKNFMMYKIAKIFG